MSDRHGSHGRWMRVSSAGWRRYVGPAAIAFGVGVAYVAVGAAMVAYTMADPSQVEPAMAGLAALWTWVLSGLVCLPLLLGGLFRWARRTQGVDRAPGCASILLSAGAGIVLGCLSWLVWLPSPGPSGGGWVGSSRGQFEVLLPTVAGCTGHPAMAFAPGVVGEMVPSEDCCSIAWWDAGRSGTGHGLYPVWPWAIEEPASGLLEWSDLDGFADYLSGTDGAAGDGFARTVLELDAGPAIRLDDERTQPSSAYLFTDGTRYVSVACSAEDPPADRWLAMAETFKFRQVEE
jgi:hypothetical protein